LIFEKVLNTMANNDGNELLIILVITVGVFVTIFGFEALFTL